MATTLRRNLRQKGIYVKVIPQQAEVAQGVPGRLRPRIFLTFGTMRVVGRQPQAPAAFTPGEIPGTHFQRHMVPSGGATEKIPCDTESYLHPSYPPQIPHALAMTSIYASLARDL